MEHSLSHTRQQEMVKTQSKPTTLQAKTTKQAKPPLLSQSKSIILHKLAGINYHFIPVNFFLVKIFIIEPKSKDMRGCAVL